MNKNGNGYMDITGYDTSLDIAKRVNNAAVFKAKYLEMDYTDVEITFLTNSYMLSDGTLFVKYASTGRVITYPPDSFQ
jgi:hypothetical protein